MCSLGYRWSVPRHRRNHRRRGLPGSSHGNAFCEAARCFSCCARRTTSSMVSGCGFSHSETVPIWNDHQSATCRNPRKPLTAAHSRRASSTWSSLTRRNEAFAVKPWLAIPWGLTAAPAVLRHALFAVQLVATLAAHDQGTRLCRSAVLAIECGLHHFTVAGCRRASSRPAGSARRPALAAATALPPAAARSWRGSRASV